jgi:nucleoside-diphosphate-sugar epimerase
MRVFVTGATGFVGSAIGPELIGGGHQVLGLGRSDAAAASLTAARADVRRGSLDDIESLRKGADAADAVIHAGFIHDFANYAAAAEKNKRAIETIGAVLAGSDRPFIVTSGTALTAPGRVATEKDSANSTFPRKSEEAAASTAAGGARVSVLRLPPSCPRGRRSRIRPAPHPRRARQGRVGVRRAGSQPLARSASARCRSSLQARAGEKSHRAPLPCGRR